MNNHNFSLLNKNQILKILNRNAFILKNAFFVLVICCFTII
ncbi:hypothetical protein GOP56_02040 [Brevibacillus sp. 7WMA2]|nr:hypothetical protein GOP56_02040 [Brevibacillus sp. 7WMA2]